jgi:DNA modification methylase
MALRGMRPPKGTAKEGDTGDLRPLSENELARFDKAQKVPVIWRPIDQLRPSPRHARIHSEQKVAGLAAGVRRTGVLEPIYIDKDGEIISGVARWLVGQKLGLAKVPTVSVEHLPPAEVRALRIGMGRFPEWAEWDLGRLRVEVPEIIVELPDLAMEEIGFTVADVDRLIAASEQDDTDPADDIPPMPETAAVSRPGDVWQLDRHLILCGDALAEDSYDRLLGNTAVRLVLTDPPYNVPVNGHVTRRIGKFEEFAMASGELSEDEYLEFLGTAFRQIARVASSGTIGYVFIDWRHARLMQEAADGIWFELKNHVVWVKDSPGLGSFYRSQHEFVLVYKIANGKHINNFELGQHGRTRTNVWHYAGMSGFGAGRDEALQMHVTPKPVGMLVEAILDCSNPGDLVLDPFGGSGSTLIAAERAHRRARLIEINPLYVDTIVRRWQDFTGQQAVLRDTNQTFGEVARYRAEPIAGSTDQDDQPRMLEARSVDQDAADE